MQPDKQSVHWKMETEDRAGLFCKPEDLMQMQPCRLVRPRLQSQQCISDGSCAGIRIRMKSALQFRMDPAPGLAGESGTGRTKKGSLKSRRYNYGNGKY